MVAVIRALKDVDRSDDTTTLDEMERTYRHPVNCDPDQDMIFAEVNGAVVGCGRGWWDGEWSGTRTYGLFTNLHPERRGRGIRRAMLRWD
jgi:hypothetical protein